MTITTGWELFEDLRAAQDEMLRAPRGQGWRPGQQFSSGTTPAAWPPAVDISETKDAYLVAVELPGVKADELEITFEDGLLTIQGERRFAHDSADEKMHRAERYYGAFRRSITLPSHVEADKIEASMQDGVLQIMVPKAPEVQAKRIQVRADQGHTVLTQDATVQDGSRPQSRSRTGQGSPPWEKAPPAVTAQYCGDGRRHIPARSWHTEVPGAAARAHPFLAALRLRRRPAAGREAAMAFGGQVVLAHDLTGSQFRPGSRQRPASSRPAGTSSAGPGHPGPGGTTPNGDRMFVMARLGWMSIQMPFSLLPTPSFRSLAGHPTR